MRGRNYRGQVLREGREGKWLRDLRVIAHMLRGLLKEVPRSLDQASSILNERILLTAFEESKELFMKFEKEIRRFDHDELHKRATSHLEPLSARSPNPADQPDP